LSHSSELDIPFDPSRNLDTFFGCLAPMFLHKTRSDEQDIANLKVPTLRGGSDIDSLMRTASD
jgi:hypothetical protein